MKNKHLIILTSLFISLMIASNLMAIKLVSFWGVMLPSAVICYPFCYCIGDIINEFYGFKTTRRVIYLAFLFNAVVTGFLALAAVIPPAPAFEGNEAFKSIFLSAPRILGASFAAFIVSGVLDSYIFDRIKRRGSHLAVRTAVSTLLGIIVDSFMFIILAYLFVMPFGELIIVALWQILAKIIVGIGLGTPLTVGYSKLFKRFASER